jgi:cytochrome c oxidase subunit II
MVASVACLGAALSYFALSLYASGAARPDLRVRVTAHQWWWEFDYPSLGIKTSNVLYLPSSKDVRLELASADILHSFWILGMKDPIEIIPGKTRSVDVVLKSTGELYGNCESGCGCGTVCMRFRVLARNPREFQQWAANERARPSDFKPPKMTAAPPCATDPSRDRRTAGGSPNTHLQRLLDGG